jgi:alpha-amylase/alpha-mannosidase (GH57 family)
MERYICIHGHFYQPPRENPWLEAIEQQYSAHPYHDWNQRITAECYAPNTSSRILDDQERIVRMVNNYAKISFNFGPTLLSWLEAHATQVYIAILEADRASQENFSGHGSALAQAYNHLILPLANRRDKYTQIVWGIQDFEKRFGRCPEGMWLPETAVDLESLDILAELGVLFTILAPHQARKIRPLDGGEWEDLSSATLDPTQAYTLNLPSGRTITLFFYNGPVSRAVAFERLLGKGESFAQRLLDSFSDSRSWPQLVHIATDGETYGHHHRFGDMGLAYAINYIESNNLARFTNYGEYLEKHAPTHEVEIYENTSWSCEHGIERWRNDCGCFSGAHPEWSQTWRAPLRQALDWLRDTLAQLYEKEAGELLRDPWGARNEYIQVVLDRSPQTLDQFVQKQAAKTLSKARKIKLLKLFELQRHAMLMYTSCGWFFDDLAGIETQQVIQYAGRALQLAREVSVDVSEQHFLELLEKATSNRPQYRNGRVLYEKQVRPAVFDLAKVGAHYAVNSLFDNRNERSTLFCYEVERQEHQIAETGKARLATGRARVTSQITRESVQIYFGVLHLGDHNLHCGINKYTAGEAYKAFVQEASAAFARADFPETLQLLDKHFGQSTYSLTSLFRDDQRRFLDSILESTLQDVEAVYRRLYEHHAPLIHFLYHSEIPPPKPLALAAELHFNAALRRAFAHEELDPALISQFLDDTAVEGVVLDTETLEYSLRNRIERLAQKLSDQPTEFSILQRLDAAVDLVESLPFRVNTWEVQNLVYQIMHSTLPSLRDKAEGGDVQARLWVDHFASLTEKLSIKLI